LGAGASLDAMRWLFMLTCLGACASPSPKASPTAPEPAAQTHAVAVSEHAPEPGPGVPEPGASESVEPDGAEGPEDQGPAHPCLDRARAHAATLAREPEGPHHLVLVEPGATFTATTLPDLDGDGVCDLDLTPDGGAWNKVWPHLLYLSRGCVSAGALVDAELTVVRPRTRGHRDIEGSSAIACAGGHFVWNRYRWDGERYREADSVTCCFCDDEEGGCSEPNPPRCAALEDRTGAQPVDERCAL